MKWFKHENTYNNPKIEMLTDEHGIIGYGVYFRLLELIASSIEESNQDEWGYLPTIYTNQYLSKKLQVDENVLTQIMDTCFELKLLELRSEKVFCPKILERCDDYTQRLIKQSENKVGTKSEENPTKNKKRREEKRKEEDNNNPQTPKGELSAFLNAFNEKFGTKYRETEGRKKNLKLRRAKFSVEEIALALDNLAQSDFHQGKNDRGWRADPDFLLRSDEQIDKWLNPSDTEGNGQKIAVIGQGEYAL